MFNFLRTGLSVVALLIVAASVHADVITLSNGDVMSGKVLSQNDDTIIFDHPVLGPLQLPRSGVTSIVRDDDIVAQQAPAEAVVEQAQAQAEAEASVAAVPPAEPPKPIKAGLFGTSLFEGWNRRFEAGISGSSGNNDSMDAYLAFKANYEDEHDRWKWDNAYLVSKQNGVTTKNQFYSEVIKDWLEPGSKVFYFAQGRYDFDDFQSWDHRVAASGGIGYQFIEDDVWNVRGRAGLGVSRTFGSGDDELRPEGVLGLEATWNINENQKLVASTTFYPSLSDPGEFRNISAVEWIIKLTQMEGLNLKFGVNNTYDSQAPAGSKKNNLNYMGALVFDF